MRRERSHERLSINYGLRSQTHLAQVSLPLPTHSSTSPRILLNSKKKSVHGRRKVATVMVVFLMGAYPVVSEISFWRMVAAAECS